MAAVQEVSGSLKAPAALLGVIVAAALGVAGTLGVTGSAARSAPIVQPAPVISHDATLEAAQKAAQAVVATQAQATNAALSRIEGKLDAQAGEIATVRESVAEIRGELRARALRK